MTGTQSQLIGGKQYQIGTPEWRSALDADQIRQGKVAGQAQGTGEGAGSRAAFESAYPGWQPPGPPVDHSEADWRAKSNFRDSLSGLISAAGRDSTTSISSTGVGSAGAIGAPPVSYDAVGGNAEAAARAAEFGRVKDNAANTASASLTGLNDALGARGLTGGGYEAGQIGGTLAREANTIGAGDRQIAESNLAHAGHVADTKYSGALAQREQDISAAAERNRAVLAEKNFELQKRQVSLQGLTAALSAASQLY